MTLDIQSIGRNAAVARIGGRIFTGFIAWLLWLVVHIAFLVGFRNRLGVLLNWAWNYIFYERAVRLILPTRNCSDYGTPKITTLTPRLISTRTMIASQSAAPQCYGAIRSICTRQTSGPCSR